MKLLNSIRNHKVTFHEALAVSTVLHIVLGVAIVSYALNSLKVDRPVQEADLVFDLVPKEEHLAPTNLDKIQKDADRVRNLAKSMGSPDSQSKTLISEDARVNRRAIMMASLASLSELRESFRFVTQKATADSIGAFTPIQGSAPDLGVFSDGAEDGYGFGSRKGIISIRGGGSGKCPPGGGGILK